MDNKSYGKHFDRSRGKVSKLLTVGAFAGSAAISGLIGFTGMNLADSIVADAVESVQEQTRPVITEKSADAVDSAQDANVSNVDGSQDGSNDATSSDSKVDTTIDDSKTETDVSSTEDSKSDATDESKPDVSVDDASNPISSDGSDEGSESGSDEVVIPDVESQGDYVVSDSGDNTPSDKCDCTCDCDCHDGARIQYPDNESSADEVSSGYYVYTIVWGDTLCGISNKFGVSVDELVELNHIANPNLIYAGSALCIPIYW